MAKKIPDNQSVQTAMSDGLLLGLILAIGFFFRFPALSVKYLDIDEAFQLFTISQPTLEKMFSVLRASGPQQYPLDYLIGFAAFPFAQTAETLRILPLAFGMAALAVAYFLGRRIAAPAFGFLWAFLLAVSLPHIQYSQTLRPYSLIVFLSLLSLLLFDSALKNKKWIPVFGIITLAYQLAYPFAAAQSAAMVGFLFIKDHKLKKELGAVLLASWIVPCLQFIYQGRDLFQNPLFTWSKSEVLGWDIARRIFLEYGQYSKTTAVLWAALFIIGAVGAFRSKKDRGLALFTLILMALIKTAAVISLAASGLFLRSRHILPVLPLYLGFVAWALYQAQEQLQKYFPEKLKSGEKGIYLLFPFLILTLSIGPFQTYQRELQQVKAYIKRSVHSLADGMRPQDKIVFNNPNSGATFVYYYDRPAFFRLEGIEIYQGFDLFKFPDPLALSRKGSNNAAFTIFRPSRALATIDADKLLALKKVQKKEKGRIWLVDLSMNYFQVADPFKGVIDDKDQLVPAGDGIYFIR